MFNNLIRKISLYRKTKLRKKNFQKKEINKLNLFASHKNAGSLTDIIVMLVNRTPEEEAESMKRVMNMAKLMANPYTEEKLNDSVSKFIHISKNEDYYYEVEKIRMDKEQYQQYLEKKVLNEKLQQKLSSRKKEKRAKL